MGRENIFALYSSKFETSGIQTRRWNFKPSYIQSVEVLGKVDGVPADSQIDPEYIDKPN